MRAKNMNRRCERRISYTYFVAVPGGDSIFCRPFRKERFYNLGYCSSNNSALKGVCCREAIEQLSTSSRESPTCTCHHSECFICPNLLSCDPSPVPSTSGCDCSCTCENEKPVFTPEICTLAEMVDMASSISDLICACKETRAQTEVTRTKNRKGQTKPKRKCECHPIRNLVVKTVVKKTLSKVKCAPANQNTERVAKCRPCKEGRLSLLNSFPICKERNNTQPRDNKKDVDFNLVVVNEKCAAQEDCNKCCCEEKIKHTENKPCHCDISPPIIICDRKPDHRNKSFFQAIKSFIPNKRKTHKKPAPTCLCKDAAEEEPRGTYSVTICTAAKRGFVYYRSPSSSDGETTCRRKSRRHKDRGLETNEERSHKSKRKERDQDQRRRSTRNEQDLQDRRSSHNERGHHEKRHDTGSRTNGNGERDRRSSDSRRDSAKHNGRQDHRISIDKDEGQDRHSNHERSDNLVKNGRRNSHGQHNNHASVDENGLNIPNVEGDGQPKSPHGQSVAQHRTSSKLQQQNANGKDRRASHLKPTDSFIENHKEADYMNTIFVNQKRMSQDASGNVGPEYRIVQYVLLETQNPFRLSASCNRFTYSLELSCEYKPMCWSTFNNILKIGANTNQIIRESVKESVSTTKTNTNDTFSQVTNMAEEYSNEDKNFLSIVRKFEQYKRQQLILVGMRKKMLCKDDTMMGHIKAREAYLSKIKYEYFSRIFCNFIGPVIYIVYLVIFLWATF